METGEIGYALRRFRAIMQHLIRAGCCVFGQCWPWLGPINDSGYGYLETPKGKRFGAHWLSYRHFKGKLPKGQEVCHSCHWRRCWNPEHLIPGTHVQNVAQARQRSTGRDSVQRGSKL